MFVVGQAAPAQVVQAWWSWTFDPAYLITRSGIIKLACIIVNIVIVCIPSASYMHVCGHLGMWLTSFWLWCYVWHIVEGRPDSPWQKIETVVNLALAGLYLICSCVVVGGVSVESGVFGFIAMVLYGAAALLTYLALRNGEPAQAPKPVTYAVPAI